MSLWKWIVNGPTVHPPDDSRNVEQRRDDSEREKSSPSVTNSTWTDLGMSPGLRSEK